MRYILKITGRDFTSWYRTPKMDASDLNLITGSYASKKTATVAKNQIMASIADAEAEVLEIEEYREIEIL